MVRVLGPIDVPQTSLRNQRRVTEVAVDRSGEAMATFGRATSQILNQARDRQIENDVAKAELRTRREMDELRVALDKDPDNETLATRWEEGVNEIMQRNAATLTSPAHQRLWQERTTRALEAERRSIVELQQTRFVDGARAGTIEVVSEARRTLVDPNASPQARAAAMDVIQTTIARAVEQRVLTASQGAAELEDARNAQAEYDATQGMIEQSTTQSQAIVQQAGGSASRALELVRALPPGQLRDRTEDRVLEYYNQQEFLRSRAERAENDAVDDAMERARVAIDRGEGITNADRDLLVRRGLWDEVQNARAAAGPGALVGPGRGERLPAGASSIARNTILAWARDPNGGLERFAGLDLRAPLTDAQAAQFGLDSGVSLLTQLQPEDFSALRDMQVGESDDNQVQDIYEQILSYAEIVAGLPENGNLNLRSQRNADAATINRFRGFILREAEAFASSGQALTQADVQRITSLALARSRGGGFLGMGGRQSYTFMAGQDGNTVLVPLARIPMYRRERIALDYYRANPDAEPLSDEEMEALIVERFNAEINADAGAGRAAAGYRFPQARE